MSDDIENLVEQKNEIFVFDPEGEVLGSYFEENDPDDNIDNIFNQIDNGGFFSKKNEKFWSLISTVAVILIVGVLWYSYYEQLDRFLSINLYGFTLSLVLIGFRFGINIVKIRRDVRIGKENEWKEKNVIISTIGIYIISLIFLDIGFETYIFAHFCGLTNFIDILTLAALIVLFDLIILSISRLVLASQIKISSELKNTSQIFKYWIPILILLASVISILTILLFNNPLFHDQNTFEIKITYAQMIPEGSYGGAEYFVTIFKVLFFNIYAQTMLGFMTIAGFATIWTVNQKKDSQYQKIGVFVMVSIPLLIIIMMLIGQIPPPNTFIEIFGADVLASFVYAFSMLCVYVVYMAILMTFIHIAEDIINDDDQF